jgi:hypothetical protein
MVIASLHVSPFRKKIESPAAKVEPFTFDKVNHDVASDVPELLSLPMLET